MNEGILWTDEAYAKMYLAEKPKTCERCYFRLNFYHTPGKTTNRPYTLPKVREIEDTIGCSLLRTFLTVEQTKNPICTELDFQAKLLELV